MAEHREPPPLFDDDDSRRDDDNEDLFSSAVQSPVNGQVTPEVNAPQATTAAALQPSNPSPTPPVSDTTPSTPASSDRSSLVAVHPFSDPLQLVADPIATSANSYNSSSNLVQPALGSFDSLGGAVNDLNTSMANTLEANSSDLNSSSDSFIVQSGSALPSYSASVMLEPVDLDSVGQAAVGESRRIIDNDGLHFESATNPSLDSEHTSLTSTTLGNLPPVPSNMYNISSMAGVEDSNNSMDLFESCVEDAIVRPFSTVSLSAPQDVNTAGAPGFDEPFSDAALFGITGGLGELTAAAPFTQLVADMYEPPAIPDTAELTDIQFETESPSIPDENVPLAIPGMADPFEFNELTNDGDEGVTVLVTDEEDDLSRFPDHTKGTFSNEEEENTSASKQSTVHNWTGPEHDSNLFAGGSIDSPPTLDAIPVSSLSAEDSTDSWIISEPICPLDDSGLLLPALPSQSTEEEAVLPTLDEPPAIEEVSTRFDPAPLAATPASAESSQSSEIVQEDYSMFPKVKAPALQKRQDAGFFLSKDETMEVPLVGPPAERKIETLTMEVSLDDDDDGLFSSGVLDTSSAQMKNSNAPIDASAPSTLPPMGAPITPPVVSPSSDHPQAPLYCANTDANSITTPPMPAALVVGQPAGFYAPSQPASLDRTSSSNANTDGEFIEILISEPQKVGDGMGSYMAYKMTTRTNISFFRKQCWSVTRRFSDYLGLHAKLVEKHLHAGRIIPPAPEKDALNTTKLRLSSGEGVDGAAEFLERRRASLQRYMQRTAALPHLRTDPDFREFVELDSDLPRATQTSAMSSAGVLRLFNRVGETVNKITFKMEESDQWFEERAQQVEALEAELRRLHAALEGLAGGRRELAAGSSALSKAAAVLSSVEEHSALSRALHQLAEATDRTHTVYHAQADADFYILCETTRDYINLIGAVKEVFHERVKVFQAWQYSQTMLAKKREAKAKLELTARQEKVAQAQQEVHEWEGKVERNQEHFERISGAIKKELEQFDVVRVQDFKSMLVRYLEAMVTSQQQVIKVWESFLPEAKAIS